MTSPTGPNARPKARPKTPLRRLAHTIRSKNAGPFWVTVDVVFRTKEDYDRARYSGIFTKEFLARLYNFNPDTIDRVIFFEPGLAIKFNIRRKAPAGSPGDADMYGAQYYTPLIDLEL